MPKNRRKQILVTLLAVLSLFVSAVSACACSHHEPAKQKAEMSCHGASHEDVETKVKGETTSDSFDSTCNCFVKTPVPAIVAKTDDKRIALEKQIIENDIVVSLPVIWTLADISPATVSELSISQYNLNLLSSLPSRAPPRL